MERKEITLHDEDYRLEATTRSNGGLYIGIEWVTCPGAHRDSYHEIQLDAEQAELLFQWMLKERGDV